MRSGTCVVLLIVSMITVSVSPAQQASTTAVPNLMGPVDGGGTTNYLPIWTGNTTLGNSTIYETGGYVGIGTTTPVQMLTVAGNVWANSVNASTYQFDGKNALSTVEDNLFVGPGAGSKNEPNTHANTFVGVNAGESNTTGSYNTFVGVGAGRCNTTGGYNTYTGMHAGNCGKTGYANTFTGFGAGSISSGSGNTFTGFFAGFNTTGYDNTFEGLTAGKQNVSGDSNTFVGNAAGYSNTTGDFNLFLGSDAGRNNTTGSENVYINNLGPVSGMESNTIRIGNVQTAAYIAGIYGSTVGGNGVAVYVDSNGQLGTVVSSRRFKEQIRNMGDSSNALMKLRPVTFLYKPEYDKGPRTLQYGLIAEEVTEVYPDLVAYDPDGKPYTVKYQYLTSMLLNEVQKQYRRADAEAEVIKSQEQRIEELEQRLSRLEGAVETSLRISESEIAYELRKPAARRGTQHR